MQKITKRLSVWAIIVAALLMVPLIGNWPWTGSDFVFAIVVLFGSALVYELVARKMDNLAYRSAVGIAVIAALLLIWINGAVGIIGDGDLLDSPNGIYIAVLAIGLMSAFITRFRPQGMAYVAFGMAIALTLVPVIALIIWKSAYFSPPGVLGVFILNSFFVIAFAVSALLFRQASAKTQ